jgi:hypothetical protein
MIVSIEEVGPPNSVPNQYQPSLGVGKYEKKCAKSQNFQHYYTSETDCTVLESQFLLTEFSILIFYNKDLMLRTGCLHL